MSKWNWKTYVGGAVVTYGAVKLFRPALVELVKGGLHVSEVLGHVVEDARGSLKQSQEASVADELAALEARVATLKQEKSARS
jgi:hypothetical protein